MLINVAGNSMEPSLYDGDLVMIDRRKTSLRSGRIYVLRNGDNLHIKRIEVVPGAALILRSDNPDQTKFPPEYKIDEAMNDISLNTVGEVVWSGHKWS